MERFQLQEGEGNVVFILKAKTCNYCVKSLTRALNSLQGPQNVHVDRRKGEFRFDNSGDLPTEKVKEAIVMAGGYDIASQ